MTDKAPDYGEPLAHEQGCIENRYTRRLITADSVASGYVGPVLTPKRIVTSVNACQGVPDPKPGELGELRALVASVHTPGCPHQHTLIVGNCCEGNDRHLGGSLTTERTAREMAEAELAALRSTDTSVGRAIALAVEASQDRLRAEKAESERDEAQRAKYGTPCKCESWIETCRLAEERAEKAEADVARLTRDLAAANARSHTNWNGARAGLDVILATKDDVARLRGLLGEIRKSHTELVRVLNLSAPREDGKELCWCMFAKQRGELHSIACCDSRVALAAAEKLELGE